MVAGKKITIISENLASRLVHRPILNAKSRLKYNKRTYKHSTKKSRFTETFQSPSDLLSDKIVVVHLSLKFYLCFDCQS